MPSLSVCLLFLRMSWRVIPQLETENVIALLALEEVWEPKRWISVCLAF